MALLLLFTCNTQKQGCRKRSAHCQATSSCLVELCAMGSCLRQGAIMGTCELDSEITSLGGSGTGFGLVPAALPCRQSQWLCICSCSMDGSQGSQEYQASEVDLCYAGRLNNGRNFRQARQGHLQPFLTVHHFDAYASVGLHRPGRTFILRALYLIFRGFIFFCLTFQCNFHHSSMLICV